jgi:hypothetical protein
MPSFWNPGAPPIGQPLPDVLQYAVRSVPYLPANSWLNNYKVNPAPWGNGNMPGSSAYNPMTVGGQPLTSGYQFPTYSVGQPGSTGGGALPPRGFGYGNDIATPGSGGTLAPGPGGVLPMPVGFYPGSSGGSNINTAIQGLLTPGLVPDIARQSAEVAAGRGVAGSGAGDSTAVRMTEQDWLQRLGLANTLLSGEAQRNLPYQITPYQQALLDLQRQQLQNQQLGNLAAFANRNRVGPGGGNNYRPVGGNSGSGVGAGNMLSGFPAGFGPTGGIGAGGSPYSGPTNSYLFGLGGGGVGNRQPSLDDIYEAFGFGPINNSGGGDISNWDWNAQPPEDDWNMFD